MRSSVTDLPSGSDLPSGAEAETQVEEAAAEGVEAEEIRYDADPVLLAAVDQARAALEEITSAASIGELSGSIVHGEHVLSLLFASRLAGYPDWNWTVTLARIDESSAPAVLETELMPSDDSLVAPDWIPWSERLADYRLAQEHAAALAAAESDDSDDEDDDLDDDDLDDTDDLDETDDDGLDLDDHIDDDSELEHDFDTDDSDDDDSHDHSDEHEAPVREHVAGRRRRSSRLDASVVVSQANETPERSAPRHLLDPHDEGFEIVTLDDSEPRSSVYYDEEADNEEH
jgi:hypothetical protein